MTYTVMKESTRHDFQSADTGRDMVPVDLKELLSCDVIYNAFNVCSNGSVCKCRPTNDHLSTHTRCLQGLALVNRAASVVKYYSLSLCACLCPSVCLSLIKKIRLFLFCCCCCVLFRFARRLDAKKYCTYSITLVNN